MSLVLERAREILTTSIERSRELASRTGESPDFRDALCFALERAAWSSIEIARHWVYERRLGVPGTGKDSEVFDLLRTAGWITLEEGRRLKQCAEYRLLSSRDLERIEWSAFKAALDADLEIFEGWLEKS